MFGGMGLGEMIVIFLVVLLLYGAKRLSVVGRGLRDGIREMEAEVKTADLRYAPSLSPSPDFLLGLAVSIVTFVLAMRISLGEASPLDLLFYLMVIADAVSTSRRLR
jgi:hypothetical protein